MYCDKAILVKREHHQAVAISLPCRAWTCAVCSENRRKQLIKEAKSGAPDKFLTLTSRRVSGRTPQGAAAELARAWRLVRLRLMRRYKLKKLPFLCVFEQTKAGWPHLHIMLRAPWLDQAIISQWMDEITGSPIVDIRKCDGPSRVAAYVAKYIGKDPHRFGTTKRYWSSKDYDLTTNPREAEEYKASTGWEIIRTSLRAWCGNQVELGYHVAMRSDGRAYAVPHGQGPPPWW